MPIHDILKACSGFSKHQNKKILRLLIEMNCKIVEHADGSRINLDRLTTDQIALLESQIKKIDSPVEAKYQI